MLHRLYVGAIVGAVVTSLTVPVGLAGALPIFALICGMAGAAIAGLISLVSDSRASRSRRRNCLSELTATDNALVMGIIVIMLLTGLIPSALRAREAARRTMVKNNLHNFSHACHGNVVRLDEHMRVVGISLSDCPVCRRARELSPFRVQPLLFYVDMTDHPFPDGEVPAETRRVAESRFWYLEAQRKNGWWNVPGLVPVGGSFECVNPSVPGPGRADDDRVFVEFAN